MGGHGWLDATWSGDAKILLAVDTDCRATGIESFILEHLEEEAAIRGLNCVHNTVRETHSDRDGVHDWLAIRGYKGRTSNTTLRKHVRLNEPAADPVGTVETKAAPDQTAVPPGHEDCGGYVNIENHRY